MRLLVTTFSHLAEVLCEHPIHFVLLNVRLGGCLGHLRSSITLAHVLILSVAEIPK